jgi:hypothetical protein
VNADSCSDTCGRRIPFSIQFPRKMLPLTKRLQQTSTSARTKLALPTILLPALASARVSLMEFGLQKTADACELGLGMIDGV